MLESQTKLDVGPRLRAAREARNLSLRTLAKRTGCSASFISQVELGQCSPSLASLQRICESLGIELVSLLGESSGSGGSPVLRMSEREALRSEWSKATAESLLPHGADESLVALLITLDPRGKTGPMPHRQGTQGFAYCVRGQVALVIGDQRHELGQGDSVLVRPNAAPSWENVGRSQAELLVVSARTH